MLPNHDRLVAGSVYQNRFATEGWELINTDSTYLPFVLYVKCGGGPIPSGYHFEPRAVRAAILQKLQVMRQAENNPIDMSHGPLIDPTYFLSQGEYLFALFTQEVRQNRSADFTLPIMNAVKIIGSLGMPEDSMDHINFASSMLKFMRENANASHMCVPLLALRAARPYYEATVNHIAKASIVDSLPIRKMLTDMSALPKYARATTQVQERLLLDPAIIVPF